LPSPRPLSGEPQGDPEHGRRVADRATVICCDIFHSLARLRELKLRFDLLLFDPPFALFSSPGGRLSDEPCSEAQRILQGEQEGWGKLFGFMESLLDENLVRQPAEALFVVEHRIKDAAARLPPKLHEVDRRKYGERALTFLAVH